MRIRYRLKYCVVFAMVFVAMGAVWLVVWQVTENIKDVNAQEDESSQESYYLSCEGAEDCSAMLDGFEEGTVYRNANTEAVTLEGTEDLPVEYDSRDKYAVRQKKQNTEGMCWLYSSVTALEYSIAKKYENYEISTKHLDYLIIDTSHDDSQVYKQKDKTNSYFDRYLAGGGFGRWSLGTSGANEEVIYGVLNPLAIMSESDFVNVLKENDSRLGAINRYEDIWSDEFFSKEERQNILKANGEGYPAYSEEQDYYKVNDPNKVEYVVTGAVMSSYPFDKTRTADSDAIKTIKNRINDYGAVKVSTFGTSNRFEKCSYKKTENNTDFYTFIVDGRLERDEEGKEFYCNANHGMTIVGWDDNWEYEYEGETKRGAFVLQNTWGEDESKKMKWHVSYTSALPSLLYFDSVERYGDYSYYYGVEDYKKEEDRKIEPAGDEYVFEFSLDSNLDSNEKIEAFVFSELRDSSYLYDVYVSDTGEVDDFKKDGEFTSRPGMTKYEFKNKYEITGDYAIKLKRISEKTISDKSRDSSVMNVMSGKNWELEVVVGSGDGGTKKTCRVANGSCIVIIPSDVPVYEDYNFLGYTDEVGSEVAKYQPGDTVTLYDNKSIYAVWNKGENLDNGEDLPVPNTSGITPETGVNTGQDESNIWVLIYISPVMVMVLVGGLSIRNKKDEAY